jgi:hypothetical protein
MERTFDQLVAAATATGTYTSFHGDGASVPWQVALPFSLPAGFTMWLYKSYLDARYPDAFKLHDWLYSPYGQLIGTYRLEADDALRERLLRDSPADAAIVYAAVRAFGAPYFNVAGAGYTGPFAPWPAPNMPVTPFSSGRSLAMSIKCVIVFEQRTGAGSPAPFIHYTPRVRVAGWTEHVWFQSDSLTDCLAALNDTVYNGQYSLCPTRAQLLPAFGSIIGVRLYQGGAGKGQFFGLSFPGSAGESDAPSSALLCAAINNTAANVRRFTLRGVPDSQITDGAFTPDSTYASIVAAYFNALSNFSFLGLQPVTKYPVASVSNAGLVTLSVPNVFPISAFITFTGCLNGVGNRVGGKFMVSTVGPLANQFTVADWTNGDTTGGSVSQPTKALFAFGGNSFTNVERLVTRRVGRPFEQFRGRKSRRRRVA